MLNYLSIKESLLLKDTLTVQELIDILQQYPKDMKVLSTWESTVNSLTKDNIYESLTGSLYLDADNNSYKENFCKRDI